MINIYICDDESSWIERARHIINGFFGSGEEFSLKSFDRAEALLLALTEKYDDADIVILDIDMPELSGFDAAAKLRALSPDILLLFYTSHEQYVFESFRFQPFRYIRKQFADRELKLAFSAAVDVLKTRITRNLMFKTKDGSLLVNAEDIVYFETAMRRIDIHMKDGRTLNVRLSLKELMRELDSPDFIMILSGVVVNVRYIKTYSGTIITLDNGSQLNVSRGRMSEVKDAVMKYWSSRL